MIQSFYIFEPEVAGGMGDETIIDFSVKPFVVEKLHYVFDDWFGSDIVETFPCYIITQHLAEILMANSITGIFLDSVTVSKSQLFYDLKGDRELPSFYWMKVVGKAFYDDIGLSNEKLLVISHKTLNLMEPVNRQFNIVTPL